MEGAWHVQILKNLGVSFWGSVSFWEDSRIKIGGIRLQRSLAKMTWSDMVTVFRVLEVLFSCILKIFFAAGGRGSPSDSSVFPMVWQTPDGCEALICTAKNGAAQTGILTSMHPRHLALLKDFCNLLWSQNGVPQYTCGAKLCPKTEFLSIP